MPCTRTIVRMGLSSGVKSIGLMIEWRLDHGTIKQRDDSTRAGIAPPHHFTETLVTRLGNQEVLPGPASLIHVGSARELHRPPAGLTKDPRRYTGHATQQ